MVEKARGSLELLWQRCEKATLGREDLIRVVEAISFDGIGVEDVFCIGIPAPEFIRGSLTAQKDTFDRLSNRLLDLQGLRLRELDVFPYGIPAIDAVRVNFEIGRGP